MENQWMIYIEGERGYAKRYPTFNEALHDAKKKALAFTTTAYVLKVVGGFGVEVFPLQVERNTD